MKQTYFFQSCELVYLLCVVLKWIVTIITFKRGKKNLHQICTKNPSMKVLLFSSHMGPLRIHFRSPLFKYEQVIKVFLKMRE